VTGNNSLSVGALSVLLLAPVQEVNGLAGHTVDVVLPQLATLPYIGQ